METKNKKVEVDNTVGELKHTIIIIAKDREQYRHFLMELSSSDKNNYIYADENSIRGVRARTVIEIGNCYERKDYYQLKYLALTRVY